MQRYFEICESTSKISDFLRCSKMKIKIQIVSIWTNFHIIYQNLPKFTREFENKAFLRRLNFPLIQVNVLYRCREMSDFKSKTRFEMVIKFPQDVQVKSTNICFLTKSQSKSPICVRNRIANHLKSSFKNKVRMSFRPNWFFWIDFDYNLPFMQKISKKTNNLCSKILKYASPTYQSSQGQRGLFLYERYLNKIHF